MTDYLVNFVTKLDPNNKTGVFWPRYNANAPKLITFFDYSIPPTIMDDTFRKEGTDLLSELGQQFPE